MNTVKEFLSEVFGKVRVITKDGEILFCASDIAKILGDRDALNLTRGLDDEEKSTHIVSTLGGNQEMLFITESGLYEIILTKRPKDVVKKERIQTFKKWITKEVIPNIRKNDGYIDKQEELSAEELMAKALLVAQKTIEEKNRKIEEQEKEIEELKPKADFTDKFLADDTLYKATDIAKEVGMSGQKFNQLLQALGIQFNQGGKWYITSRYDGNGYTKPYMFEYRTGKFQTHMRWTSKGRKFILDLFSDLELIK